MDITRLLKAVILDIKARDHASVLKEMTGRLFPEGRAHGEVCDLKGHESTEGILSGTGAAVFHCLSEEVKETAIALAVSRRALPHPSRKTRVRIFFLIISPLKESGTHLQLLSKIEGLVLDPAFRHALLLASSPEEAMRAVKRAEAAGRSLYMPLSGEEVYSEFGTSPKGLSEEEAASRLKLTGANSIKRIEKGTLLKDFLHNMFLNLFAVLLWAGGAMSFVAGMPELGWAIFLVIVINASFSFWQEYKAERAVEALKNLLPKKVRVVRNGQEREIDAASLVPGDLIKLSEGESVPADGRLVASEAMRVDNSPLTGESRPIYKVSDPLADGKGFIWTEVPNMVFAGTTVLSGDGAMIVTATGMDTEIGRVAYLTQAIKAEASPLQREIVNITKVVTAIAVFLGVSFFLVGVGLAGLTYSESFIFAIGIIVANVPEGLLPTVSLSLAMGVQRMAGKKAIVKKLSAVETLGSATVICTDKTGTLTQNRMCATRLFVNNRTVEVTGTGYGPEGGFFSGKERLDREGLKKEGALDLLAVMALCNNARLHPPVKGRDWTITGDPTEGALLTVAAKAGLDLASLEKNYRRVGHLPFERIRKRMTTIHEAGGGLRAFVKGSPKEVLALCERIHLGGKVAPLTDDERELVLRENDSMARRGLRVLAAAYREVEKKGAYQPSDVEKELVFAGLIAMLDPPRPGVREAVAECHTAGIKVVMVTGDYGLTARSIAEEIGIGKDARLLTGDELGAMSAGELREALKKGETIFARVAPADKLRVVEAFQANGETVAVTGDGVNDAPALKKADIGIAMGLRGSDAAKESAEIVLADDNFASIVDAIREGRAVYANIRKFVTYIFASNIPELVPFIAFVIFKIPLPLTVMQILAVDLGTDVLPALGLGVEPPEAGVMKEPPRPRGKRLLDLATLARAYLFLGPIEAILAMSAFFFAYWLRGWVPGDGMKAAGAIYAAATTMTFAGIVASQIGNVFACRTSRLSVFSAGFLKNRLVLFAIAAEVALSLILIFAPLNRVFGFAPLGIYDFAFLSAFPFIILLAEEVRKSMARKLSPASVVSNQKA